ncbi:hypothetical protein LIER_02862 [Lithospermum erythrorhizon]|uniref:Pentatricopeptide repeat-containing protein n=1 Tax=Lithospermum erythrorhizon TaxID=34254 RepID=A0AAV3NSL0_LITER
MSNVTKIRTLVPPTNGNNYHLNSPTSSYSLATVLQQYINSDTPFHGQNIHCHIIKTGFKPNTNITIKLLILYIKSSCLPYARQLFDDLTQPTLSAYNYMISGYVKHGFIEKSFDLMRQLSFLGERPDGYTFSMILKGCSCENLTLQNTGKEVHAQVVKSCIEGDDVLFTALVDFYVKSGRVDNARRVFDMILEKNVFCSTSLITGYMNQGCVAEAEDLFRTIICKDVVIFNAMIEGYSKSIKTSKKAIDIYIEMQRLDFKPTISTFSSVIGACSVLSAFEVGQQIQGQLAKIESFTNIKMGSALVDMYCKCGKTEDARRVFDHMSLRNVFTWTSILDGYGKNGESSQALELFDIMLADSRVQPNYVTFLSVLSACSHAGLVEKGREVFQSMERHYFMKPRMEHYACMVDLLGRAGSLTQALEFILDMPDKPNSDVWAALLSCCRLHGDVELANIAANELFKLSGDSRPGAYVALSNTLAEMGRWDNVMELRELMKVRGVSKGTGFSWVGTDAGAEPFHAGQQI